MGIRAHYVTLNFPWPVNLKLTRILLGNEGFKVSTAASAEEALELLRSYHPRLILADVQLPGIDRLEMTRLTKWDERTRYHGGRTQRLCHEEHDEQRARQAGCDGYRTKPIDTRTMAGRVRQLLKQRAEAPAPPPTERESGSGGTPQPPHR